MSAVFSVEAVAARSCSTNLWPMHVSLNLNPTVSADLANGSYQLYTDSERRPYAIDGSGRLKFTPARDRLHSSCFIRVWRLAAICCICGWRTTIVCIRIYIQTQTISFKSCHQATNLSRNKAKYTDSNKSFKHGRKCLQGCVLFQYEKIRMRGHFSYHKVRMRMLYKSCNTLLARHRNAYLCVAYVVIVTSTQSHFNY